MEEVVCPAYRPPKLAKEIGKGQHINPATLISHPGKHLIKERMKIKHLRLRVRICKVLKRSQGFRLGCEKTPESQTKFLPQLL